jgi:hypothetical protein
VSENGKSISILDIVVDADDAGIFFAAEEGSLRPADIIRNPVFQQCSLDELLAIGIGYFAQFNLIINFQSGI